MHSERTISDRINCLTTELISKRSYELYNFHYNLSYSNISFASEPSTQIQKKSFHDLRNCFLVFNEYINNQCLYLAKFCTLTPGLINNLDF